jgi:hypothetical protein
MRDYFKDTHLLEFISDVYDIMRDGDCLPPEKLIADIVVMLGEYLTAQKQAAKDTAETVYNQVKEK